MANEKVYVGEEGAKELYRRIKGSLPATNSWKQWSEDNGSSSRNIPGVGDQLSIYVGAHNTLTSWRSVAVGTSNTIYSHHSYSIGESNVIGSENDDNATHDSMVVGSHNTVGGDYQIALFGYYNNVDQSRAGTFNTPIVGFSNSVDDSNQCIIIGQGATSYSNDYSTLVGADLPSMRDTQHSTVVGSGSTSIRYANYATAVGNAVHIRKVETDPISGDPIYKSCDNSTGIGNYVNIAGRRNNVLGYSASVTGDGNVVAANNSDISGDENVVIGRDNVTGSNNIKIGGYSTIAGRNDVILIGRYTTISKDSEDQSDYSGTNLIGIGEYNSFAQAANAFQFGRSNTVTGNNLANVLAYPHQMALNLGMYNTVNAEGVNVGKDNTAASFGANVGRDNYSANDSISIGSYAYSDLGSVAIGKGAYPQAAEEPDWVKASNGSFAIGSGKLNADAAGFALGFGNMDVSGGSVALGLAMRTAGDTSVVREASAGFLADGVGRNGIGASYIKGCSIGFGAKLKLEGTSFSVGVDNHSIRSSYSFGLANDTAGSSFAYGNDNKYISEDSHVVGRSNQNITHGSSVLGLYNNAIGMGYIDSETGTMQPGSGFVVGGNNSYITGGAVAIGTFQSKIYHNALGIGFSNRDVHEGGFAVGHNNQIVYSNGIAFGSGNNTVNSSSVAVGFDNINVVNNSVAVGTHNQSVREGSIAIGYDNSTTQYGSISIGLQNKGSRGAMIMGMRNNAYIASDSDYHANAAIIGIDNTLSNNRELFKVDTVNNTREWVFGFIAGSTNSVYGHNAFVVGVHNAAGDSAAWSSDGVDTVTDNDGFMTAIGYNCLAVRNYDMAIGYRSVANGGENLAVTNSTAVGYRNLAYNHSDVKGICNTALNESSIACTQWDDTELPKQFNTFNTLQHSIVTYHNRYPQNDPNHLYDGVSITENHFENIRCTFNSIDGVFSNFIFGDGSDKNEPGPYYHSTPVNVDASVIASNMIFLPRLPCDIAAHNLVSTGSVSRNLLLHSWTALNSIQSFNSNIAISSDMVAQMDPSNGDGDVNDNMFVHSTFSVGNGVYTGAKFKSVYNNLVWGSSTLLAGNTTGTIWNNVLLGTSKLEADTENTIWGNDGEGTVSNFLFGSDAKKSLACVSFGDGGDTMLANTMYTYNFGDNKLYNTSKSFVAGMENTVNAVMNSAVFGGNNEFIDTACIDRFDLSANDPHMSGLFVQGDNNTFNKSTGQWFSRIFVSGDHNTITGGSIYDSMAKGTTNTIGGFPKEAVYKTSAEVWDLVVADKTYVQVTDAGYLPGDGVSTCGVYLNDYYYYNRGFAYNIPASPLPPGVTVTQISGDAFVQGVRGQTLTDDGYYLVTSYPTVVSDVPKLNVAVPNTYCIKYANGTVFIPTPGNTGVDIFGNSNEVSPSVCYAGVFGCESLVMNETDTVISGIFMQGIKNKVYNGSNIVCMGNGNVSTGHGSVAIGNQLISNRWQTVVGKYNAAKSGPNRVIDIDAFRMSTIYSLGDVVRYDGNYYKYIDATPSSGSWDSTKWEVTAPDADAVLFMIGNGYSETDNYLWQDEQYIHRSNAMEVYADGTVKAHDFVSDNELTLDGANGVTVAEDLQNSKIVISLDTATLNVINFLKNRPDDDTYTIKNDHGTLSWARIGTATV